MKNGFILFVLFGLLNIDIAALWLYANAPLFIDRGTEAYAEVAIEPRALDTQIETPEIPTEKTEVIIPVDIIVPPAVEEEVEENSETLMAEIPDTIIPEPTIPAIRHDIMLTDISNFRQDERGWAYDPLGHTRQTLREYGCTVTSVANAITNYDRDYITPRMLNKNLMQVGGYTDRGWLVWSQIERATDGKYSARVFSGGNKEAQIDSCLANNEYPVVKIFLRGEVQHWVLVVGRKNGEYMVRDPLEGDRDEHPIPLSSRADKVHSVRCIGPN